MQSMWNSRQAGEQGGEAAEAEKHSLEKSAQHCTILTHVHMYVCWQVCIQGMQAKFEEETTSTDQGSSVV